MSSPPRDRWGGREVGGNVGAEAGEPGEAGEDAGETRRIDQIKGSRHDNEEAAAAAAAFAGVPADAARKDKDGFSPLMLAAAHGHDRCVALILHAFQVRAAGSGGTSGGRNASAGGGGGGGSGEVLSVNDVDIVGNRSSLYLAADRGHDACVALLVAVPGVNLSLAAANGDSPLHRSARGGFWRCMQLLLDASLPPMSPATLFDVNAPGGLGGSPLREAAFAGHYRCVELLLGHPSIDVNAADQRGCGPLYAAANQGNGGCLALLLRAPGVDMNQQDVNGFSPLMTAVAVGRHACTAILLGTPGVDNGVDVNLADHLGNTALIAAFIYVRDNMVDRLSMLDGRTPVNHEDDPARSFVLLLQSRRISMQALTQTIAQLRHVVPSKREIALAEAGGPPLSTAQKGARTVLPVLEAQIRMERRWCGWCLRLTPDRNLDMCGGCKQFGYCDRVCCQKKHWAAGHKQECGKFAVGAGAGAGAGGGGGVGGGGGGGGVEHEVAGTLGEGVGGMGETDDSSSNGAEGDEDKDADEDEEEEEGEEEGEEREEGEEKNEANSGGGRRGYKKGWR